MDSMTTSTELRTTHSTPASLMGKVPITLLMRNGTLKLEHDRLTFTTTRGKTLFDHPVAELHSVGPVSRVGMRFEHGDRTYRLVPCYQAVGGVNTSNDLVDVVLGVAQLSRSMTADQRMRSARDEWIDILRPLARRIAD
jgi:hypothetical protein